MTAARLALDLALSPLGLFTALGFGTLAAAALLERFRP